MKIYKKILIITISSTALMGCKNSLFSQHIACNDEQGLALVDQVIQQRLNQSLDQDLKTLIEKGQIKDLDPAKLKLSAKTISFKMSDSRTEFIDPNSPKTSCAIDLNVTIPSDLITKSDEVRAQLSQDSTSQQADSLDLFLDHGKMDLVLEYVLQPTDKKDKVLASVQNFHAVNQVISDTLITAFLKPQIEKNQIQMQEQQHLKEQRQAAVERASAALEAQQAVEAASAAAVEAAYDASYE